jgi:hypothetical protein
LDNPVRIGYAVTPICRYNLRLSGPAGKSFILQTTTNLTTWTALWTNPAPTGVLEFNDTRILSDRSRFYRVVSIP